MPNLLRQRLFGNLQKPWEKHGDGLLNIKKKYEELKEYHREKESPETVWAVGKSLTFSRLSRRVAWFKWLVDSLEMDMTY